MGNVLAQAAAAAEVVAVIYLPFKNLFTFKTHTR